MMVLEVDIAEPGTGIDASELLRARLQEPFPATNQSPPARVIYVGRRPSHAGIAGANFLLTLDNITDPNAQTRFSRRSPVEEMAQNLGSLSAAAKIIIPGLRDLTAPEQANLRHYYKKLYRKV